MSRRVDIELARVQRHSGVVQSGLGSTVSRRRQEEGTSAIFLKRFSGFLILVNATLFIIVFAIWPRDRSAGAGAGEEDVTNIRIENEVKRREALQRSYDDLLEKYNNVSERANMLDSTVKMLNDLEAAHINLTIKELEEYRQLQLVTSQKLDQFQQLENEMKKPKLFDPGALGVISVSMILVCTVTSGKEWLKQRSKRLREGSEAKDEEEETSGSSFSEGGHPGQHRVSQSETGSPASTILLGRSMSVEGDSIIKKDKSAFQRWKEEMIPGSPSVWMDNFGAGLVCGAKYCTGMVAFAALLYSAPELEQYMPLGIKSNLWSCVVAQICYCLVGGFPFGMALPQDIPCLLVGSMGSKLAGMVEPECILPTFMLLVSAQAMLCSILFYASYATGLTKLVMQLPSSLLSGFIFANGLGLIKSAGKTLSRVDWRFLWPSPQATGLGGCVGFACLVDKWTFLHICVGVLNFLMILKVAPKVKARLNKGNPSCLRKLLASFVPPLAMVSMIPFFYWAMFCGWVTWDTAREHQWLQPPEKNPWDMRFWHFWLHFYDVRHWNLAVVMNFLPDMVSVAIISLLEASMGGSSVESSCPRDEPLDLGVELRAHALSNFICGATGGSTVFLQTGMTINACRTDGASHRLAGLVAAAICFAIFCLGVPIVTYAPRFMSGAVFIVVGYIMIKDSAIDTIGTMPLKEYMGIIVCGMIYMLQNMEAAMTWGFFYAMFVFLGQSVGHKVVKSINPGTAHPSHKERPQQEQEIVSRLRKKIMWVKFDGMVFWGSSRHIFDNIYPLLRQPKIKYIVFDMDAVLKIDGSACKALSRIVQLGHFQGVRFCFRIRDERNASDDSKIYSNLRAGGLLLMTDPDDWSAEEWPAQDSACPYFLTEDQVAEFCEDAVFHDRQFRALESNSAFRRDSPGSWQGSFSEDLEHSRSTAELLADIDSHQVMAD